MKRPQYVFRPNLSDPQHHRAWVLLQQIPSAKRKEFLVQSILAAEKTDRMEESIRKVVREELQAVNITNAAPSPPPENAMRNHDVWIYVRCANSDPRIAFDRLYDLIDEAAGHGFLVRGTSFDHCSGNTLKDRIGLRSMLDAVENGRIEAVMVRDLEQIGRNSYILVGVIEALRQNDVYLITTECDLNAELINSGLERFVGDRFTRASFGKPRFDVRLPLMDQF